MCSACVRVESGFNHVEPEKYTPRLLHFKGKKVPSLWWSAWLLLHFSSLPSPLPLSLPLSLPPSLSSFLIQDNVRVDEVKCRRKYLNSGDVFILDLGLDLYQVCVDEADPAHLILLLSFFSGMALRATRMNAPKLWSSFKL